MNTGSVPIAESIRLGSDGADIGSNVFTTNVARKLPCSGCLTTVVLPNVVSNHARRNSRRRGEHRCSRPAPGAPNGPTRYLLRRPSSALEVSRQRCSTDVSAHSFPSGAFQGQEGRHAAPLGRPSFYFFSSPYPEQIDALKDLSPTKLTPEHQRHCSQQASFATCDSGLGFISLAPFSPPQDDQRSRTASL